MFTKIINKNCDHMTLLQAIYFIGYKVHFMSCHLSFVFFDDFLMWKHFYTHRVIESLYHRDRIALLCLIESCMSRMRIFLMNPISCKEEKKFSMLLCSIDWNVLGLAKLYTIFSPFSIFHLFHSSIIMALELNYEN